MDITINGNFYADLTKETVKTDSREFADWLIHNHGLTEEVKTAQVKRPLKKKSSKTASPAKSDENSSDNTTPEETETEQENKIAE